MTVQQDSPAAIPSGPVAMTLHEVRAKIKLSRSTIYKLMEEGKFPKPAKIGKRSFWLISEVDAWLLARFDER